MLTIVTESSSGLTRDEAEELGVTLIPTYYSVDGVTHRELYTNECGNYREFLCPELTMHTEPAFPQVYVEAFSKAFAQGNDVLCITISSRLSAGYRSALNAEKFFYGEEIVDEDTPGERHDELRVIDSYAAGSALELLVRTARAAAYRGLSFEEIVAAVEARRDHIHTLFSVPDMAVLRRSGRLTNTRRSVTATLDRFPVFELKRGAIATAWVARGTAGMAKTMLLRVPADVKHLMVAYYGEDTKALHRLVDSIHRQRPDAYVTVKDGGPALTTNLGIGAVSLIWDDGE